MTVSNEVSSEIASALMLREFSEQDPKALGDLLLRIHYVLQYLEYAARAQRRDRRFPEKEVPPKKEVSL
jgi:hypothetical protein